MQEPALLRTERLKIYERCHCGLSLDLKAGALVGLWGEAGSGKSRVLKVLARLERPVEGRLFWEGAEVTKSFWRSRAQRTFTTLLLPNPYTALPPWSSVQRVMDVRPDTRSPTALLNQHNLPTVVVDHAVRTLSGLERMRLMLARALSNDPRVVLVDDLFSNLLPEVWSLVWDELNVVTGKGRALLVASRSLAALAPVRHLFVLRNGDVVEWGTRDAILRDPRHPYTRHLLENREGVANWRTPYRSKTEGARQDAVQVSNDHWYCTGANDTTS